jgi:hypothetical protein
MTYGRKPVFGLVVVGGLYCAIYRRYGSNNDKPLTVERRALLYNTVQFSININTDCVLILQCNTIILYTALELYYIPRYYISPPVSRWTTGNRRI